MNQLLDKIVPPVQTLVAEQFAQTVKQHAENLMQQIRCRLNQGCHTTKVTMPVLVASVLEQIFRDRDYIFESKDNENDNGMLDVEVTVCACDVDPTKWLD